MVSSIILSKDRASQLELLLRSSKKHCGKLFEETLVLWGASTPEFDAGYTKLKNAWPEVRWFKDGFIGNFEEDYREIVKLTTSKNLAVTTDDCFFYRDVDTHRDKILETLARDDIASFLLGIGGDSTRSEILKYDYRVPAFTNDGELLVWNWKKADRGEFSCPYMLIANFYEKTRYVFYLDQTRFQNPSTLECNLAQTWQIDKPDEMVDLCACLKYQALVHSSNNRVQDDFKNLNGMVYPFSATQLNDLYLDGKVIDLENLDLSQIKGLHREINYLFREDTA